MEADTSVALYDFYGWLQTNRKRVVAGVIVVAVIAAVIAAVIWNKSQNEENANQALLAVPSLLIETTPGDSPPSRKLLDISQNYPGTSAAAIAQMMAARSLFMDGKYADAEHEFSKFITDYSDNAMVPQANVGIAACLEAQGKTGEAMQQYKKVNTLYASSPSIVMPVKLTLGRLSEADNKPQQAVGYYKELVTINDQNDPWVAEASERLRLLVAKHPELNPFPPQGGGAGAAPSGLMAPSPAEMQLTAPAGSPGTAPAPTAPPATNSPPSGKP